MHQHGADREVRRDDDADRRVVAPRPRRSGSNPVVPTTTCTPWSMPQRDVDRARRGAVKSTATSIVGLAAARRARPSSTSSPRPVESEPSASRCSPGAVRRRPPPASVRSGSRRRRPGRPRGPSGRVAPTTPDAGHAPASRERAPGANGPSTVSVIGCDSTRSATRRASSRVTRLDPPQRLVDGEDLAVRDLGLAQARHPAAGVLERQDQRALHVALRALELLVGETPVARCPRARGAAARRPRPRGPASCRRTR